jgi:hypothetical protein
MGLRAKLFGWDRMDAKLIDQRFLRRDAYQSEHGGRTPFQVWEYMVELPPDEGGKRLLIEEKTFNFPHPGPQNGDTMPIRVNGKRTKAAFDLDDPRLDVDGKRKAREKREREEDEARFKAKLEGRD